MQPTAHHRSRRLLPLVVVLLAGACTATGSDPEPRVERSTPESLRASASASGASSVQLAALRRPWAQPQVPVGTACPVTTVSSRPDPELGLLLGSGPGRPSGLDEGAVFNYLSPKERPDWTDKTWGGQKVLWAVDPAQTGPVLVRGRRLDGPGALAFDDPAVAELVLNIDDDEGRGGGWKDYPSYTRVRVPGCYAYQVDTAEGTWTIVFTARGPSVT